MVLSNVVFSVNDDPFCIWDVSLAERNLEYLEQFDCKYFEYLAITGLNGIEDEHHQKHAALLILFSSVNSRRTAVPLLAGRGFSPSPQ